MKFFFDENFPRAAAGLLDARGHEWADIRGTDQEGSDDTTIFRMAQQQGAVFLTTDRDFFHTVPHLQYKQAWCFCWAHEKGQRHVRYTQKQSTLLP